jgi:hypothetical protein
MQRHLQRSQHRYAHIAVDAADAAAAAAPPPPRRRSA